MSTLAAGSAAERVRSTLFRALAVVRLVVLVYVLALNVVRSEDFARPAVAWATMAVLVLWSAWVSWAYVWSGGKSWSWYAADLAVAVAALLVTPYAEGQAMQERHAASLPSYWVMTPVLAWAAGRGLVPGVLAALCVAAADLSIRVERTDRIEGNIFLLLLASVVIGFTSTRLQEAAELSAYAERTRAAYEERTRLSRAVHDGVLQVLALVQRRAGEGGGDLAELGRLAGEQERALRALVQHDARPVGRSTSGRSDLVAALAGLADRGITVSDPGHRVELSATQVSELHDVVAACLDNVRVHVGPDAPAWVLIEELGDSVVISVRDEGPGIPPGRLEEARAEGRLGVASSIQGRMRDLGGRAELVSTPGQGTEWELSVPRS